MPETAPLTVAFVLVSYTDNAPAGMERATAALAHGLRGLGHRALIITAVEPAKPADDVMVLRSLEVTFPCDDTDLRDAITRRRQDLDAELRQLYRTLEVDLVVYVDALWGLGRIAPTEAVPAVLAMHVVGHDEDLRPALQRTGTVVAPSATVLHQAHDRGYDTSCWKIVPNALLHDHGPPDADRREVQRRHGPIRVLARLGPEKNVGALLEAGRTVQRAVEVIVGEAAFELASGAQQAQWLRCARAAAHLPLGSVRSGSLDWSQVQPWLAQASVVIVPSTRETFGLVALEAMSVGTPVIAFDVGNLPELLGEGGVIVSRKDGEAGLWRAAEQVLDDPVRYADLSRAVYYRSRDYLPTSIATTFVKAVR